MVKENKYFVFDRPYEQNLKNKLSKVYRFLKIIYYKVNSFCYKAEKKEKKYKVSVCSIFKNEAPYLREWIEFNHLVGVEHFYMYNNNSEDDYMSILKPYIDKDIVTLVQWPYNQMQMESYKDCIEKYSEETNWLGFIDIDEFIVPKSTDTIYEFLKPFESTAGAVLIYWKLFGTSGQVDRNMDGLVSEDFTVCWPKYCDIGKCFYNTAFGFNSKSKKTSGLHHLFWASYKNREIPPVNVFRHISCGGWNVADEIDFPIQINHYFTKSFNEYASKRAKGDVYFKINPHDEAYFFEHEMKCTSTDFSAYKYLIKLKMELKNEEI